MSVIAWMCCLLGLAASAELHEKLRYFETLHHHNLHKRVRRSADPSKDGDVHLSLFTLGRHFDLRLRSNAGILAPGFKASVVHADGSQSPLFLNANDFFVGHLAGDETSYVNAHLEDGVWTAEISTKEDVYTIEPSWRHLPPSDNHTLISYRKSDIRWDRNFPDLQTHDGHRQKLCNSIRVEAREDEVEPRHRDTGKAGGDGQGAGGRGDPQEPPLSRVRRQAWLQQSSTCQLLVVADHLFHKDVGGGFRHRTANYLVAAIQAVDNLYHTTTWDSGLQGFGLQVKEMLIHEAPTKVSSGYHYNMQLPAGERWGTRELLEMFSANSYFSQFCLAHLFTSQPFSGGVLGLAYIASPRHGTVGGICSPVYKKGSLRLQLNTGWSSARNTNNDRLLTQEAKLVTAHEIGHNWGSEHDTDTAECAPNSFNKGKFIMYPYAVSGYEENNFAFSPCSKRYVTDVIKAKAYNCFTQREVVTPYCGDGIVNTGEQCDGGQAGKEGQDPCCDPQCRFIGDATCSAANHECCAQCQMAPPTFLCRGASPLNCQNNTHCNGSSFDCPAPVPAMDGTRCFEGGTCHRGECKSFCQTLTPPRDSCRCETERDSCHPCCQEKVDGKFQCRKFGADPLPDGRPCFQGYCQSGTCRKSDTQLVERVFDFIEKLTPQKFVEFMKSNIVGTVIIFSMVLWIPASWTISCIDKRREQRMRSRDRWRSRESHELIWPSERGDLHIKRRQAKIGRPPRPNFPLVGGPGGDMDEPEEGGFAPPRAMGWGRLVRGGGDEGLDMVQESTV